MDSSGSRRTTVVLADDQPAMITTLTKLLSEYPDLELVGTGRNAEEALKLCVEHEPDVAVLDVRMPLGGGPVAALEIRNRGLRTRVVAFSAFNDEVTREQMTSAGAIAYVLKDGPVRELLDAIRVAASEGKAKN